MKKNKVILLTISLLCLLVNLSSCNNPNENIVEETKIVSLKTNSENSPLGIDDAPDFSWNMESNIRGQCQTAYQILVSTDYEMLEEGSADTWDSGKIVDSRSISIPYEGNIDLKNTTPYFWKVNVWDKNDNMLESEIASFETGLGTNGFNDASFIVANKVSSDPSLLDLKDANWIMSTNGQEINAIPAGNQYFRFKFTPDSSKTLKSALVLYSADDYSTTYLNEHKLKSITTIGDIWKNGTLIDVTDHIVSGENLFVAEVTNRYKGYTGLIAKLELTYTDNSKDTFVTNEDWRVYKYFNEGFYKKDFNDSLWVAPDKMVNYEDSSSPWGKNVQIPVRASKYADNAPMFRKEFSLQNKAIKSARIYATAAGIYDLYFNGERASNALLTPSWTEYSKHLMYQTYDVTDKLNASGYNVIGAQIGNGYYACRIGGNGQTPAFLCKMVVNYQDGTKQTIVSDTSWSSYTAGPVSFNDLFDGEHIDNGLNPIGWNQVNYQTNSNWLPSLTVDKADLKVGDIIAQIGANIEIMEELKPISVNQIAYDTFIYDFGQNFAGIPEIKFTAEKGQEVRIRYAEMLNDGSTSGDGPEGTLYLAGLRTAEATDYFTFSGNGIETFMPSLTYHGFRYLEIKGLRNEVSLDNIKGLVLYSNLETTASFETSEPLINQLCSNAFWSQKSNFLGVPTDCPQRDERIGWTGDTQIFFNTASYFMNTKEFYIKHLMDINDNQRPNGAYADVAPGSYNSAHTMSGHNGWGDAGVILPYYIYRRYGDASPIREYYSNMAKYIDYLVNDSTNFIRNNDPNGYFGDWLSIGESTPLELCNTAYCVYVCDLMAEMAKIINKGNSDVSRYQYYAKQYRNAWNNAFIDDEGKTKCNTQTSYVLGLYFNIIPEDLKSASASFLAQNITNNNNKLTTGFLGVSYLMPVLCEYGHTDVAFKLLEQEEYPSWLYPVLQGATTIWERWNSYTIENGFGNANMNSFNHYSYGSVMEWAFSTILGIAEDTSSYDNVGFKNFILRPTQGGKMTYAKGHYDSPYGKIYSSWVVEGNKFNYECSLPANTTATLYLEGNKDAKIYEGNKLAKESNGIKYIGYSNGRHVFELVSGTYSFSMEF